MSKGMSRRGFVTGLAAGAMGVAAAGAMAGCSAASSRSASAVYTAGTYTAVQETPFAEVEVTCAFDDAALAEVTYRVTRTSESDYFPMYENGLQDFCASIVEAGRTEGVDTVTGATLCSSALVDGVNACKLEALAIPVTHAMTGQLNSQNAAFDSFDGTLDQVFSPIKLGSMELPNRVVKTAGSGISDISRAIDIYGSMADNGVSLNLFAGGVIRKSGILPSALDPEGGVEAGMAAIVPLIDRIHDAGGRVGFQLCYGGLAPTVPDSMINESTVEELDQFIEDVGTSASRAKAAGFDCVEVKGASADGLNGFLTRRVNKREDEYGPQSIENRSRLFCRVIQKIKEVNGDDFPVGALINAAEENDANLGDDDLFMTIGESQQIAKALEDAGADWIQLRVGASGQEMNIWAPDVQHIVRDADGLTGYGTIFDYSSHFDGVVDGSHSGFASFMPAVKAVKEVVSVPVGCAACLDLRMGPDYINEAIENGELDLVFMNRPLNCDPELVSKMRAGKREEVVPCMKCMHCHDNMGSDRKYPSTCRMNPTFFNAYTDVMPEGVAIPEAETKRSIMVVGAGPAGMEAARVAALRGHSVDLYEMDSKLGGSVHFARGVKGNHERFDDYLTYAEHQMEAENITVHLGEPVTIDTVKGANPDAVVVAVGGTRPRDYSGANVFSAKEAFGNKNLGDNVVVLGGNVQAIDFAASLVAQGKKVTIVSVNSVDDLDRGQSGWFKKYIMPYLYANGVKAWCNAAVDGIEADAVIIATQTGDERKILCDSVVDFSDMLPNTELADAIGAAGFEVYAVGDCAEPWDIQRADTNAHLCARAL